jgi:short-subunit dehydrogenase
MWAPFAKRCPRLLIENGTSSLRNLKDKNFSEYKNMDYSSGSHGDEAFQNKVVVITGGSSGIGKQVARDLLYRRAQVVISSDIPDNLTAAKTELGVDARECDVRDAAQVRHLADYVLERYGRIDILINNAGYAVYRPFEESSLEEVLDIVDVNLSGAMRCAKAFLPSMMAQRSGRIVNISSVGGETIITPNAAYCAAKHGMVAWSKAIRYELAHFGISVNVVCPGHTKTNFHDHPTFRRRNPYRKKSGKSLTVEKVSAAILNAINTDRVVTFVPRWQGLIAWALNALPFMAVPVWDRLMRRRIAQLYEQIESTPGVG